MRRYLVLALLPAWLLTAAPATADIMRCDGKVISTEDRSFDVLRHCGEPSFRDEWDEYLAYHHQPSAHVEEWHYNFGSSRLLHVLRFRNGRLTSIDTAGYGFDENNGGRCRPGEIVFGMTQFALLAQCGEPDARERRIELRSFPRKDGHRTYPVSVRVDEWLYNFGPSSFIRIVTLINGRVDEVETGERGY
jgi:hypothetical protein